MLLKHLIQIFIFCLASFSCHAQNFHLKIIGTNDAESKIIDSISYNSKHINLKSLFDETKNTSLKLSKIGYIENNILKNDKVNDSTYTVTIELKENIKYIHIYIGTNNSLFKSDETKKDTIIIPYLEFEN